MDDKRLPPMLAQYRQIKARFPDALVLFRLGDFYETFENDAQITARELELVLTTRSFAKGVRLPMAGVPHHHVQAYLAKLIDKGYKVALVEQLEDPKKVKRQQPAGSSKQQAGNVQVQVTAREAELLNAHLEEYRTLGIDIEPFGENTFRVNALPTFATLDAREFLTALLEEHEHYCALDGDALRDKLAAKAACVCAIKAGDALTPEQQQALLDELLQAYAPATCPHGRPVFVTLRLEELERRFLRRN